MSIGLLFDCDDQVANWTFQRYGMPPMKFDKALGLISPSGDLIGSVVFQSWNGFNLELSYYGQGTVRAGIVRCLAQFVLIAFDPARVTVTTKKTNKRLMRSLQRMGFKLEGASRRFYGQRDCNRNTGVHFVMFRERIEQLAATPQSRTRLCS